MEFLLHTGNVGRHDGGFVGAGSGPEGSRRPAPTVIEINVRENLFCAHTFGTTSRFCKSVFTISRKQRLRHHLPNHRPKTSHYFNTPVDTRRLNALVPNQCATSVTGLSLLDRPISDRWSSILAGPSSDVTNLSPYAVYLPRNPYLHDRETRL